MKKAKLWLAFTLLVSIAVASCTRRYTCPTYLKNNDQVLEKKESRV